MKKKLLNCICPQSVLLKIKQCFHEFGLNLYSVLKRLLQTWPLFCTVGQLSHASPTPSRSPSSCRELCTIRQLSIEFNTPGEKKKKRQAVANINTGKRK